MAWRMELARWVAREILPHEAAVRAWLRRSRVAPEQIDDIVQEAYCRLAALERIDHIERPDAYFFSTVRNLLLRQLSRAKVVPFVPLTGMEDLIADSAPSPERTAGARLVYDKIVALLAGLPKRRRLIFEMRKLEGRSQREIAAALGISENVVEHEIRTGLVELQRAWQQEAHEAAERLAEADEEQVRRA